MSEFIILGIDRSGKELYVANTSPIIWTSERKDAKILSTKKSAIIDLEEDFIFLSATITYTDLIAIEIAEYKNDQEIGREKYL